MEAVIQELRNISKNNKYLRWYIDLIKTRSCDVNPEEYSEVHHIIPRSIGGRNDRNNLVRIPARVHFILHLLLVRFLLDPKHRRSMVHAANMLGGRLGDSRYVNSRLYASLRKLHALETSKRFKEFYSIAENREARSRRARQHYIDHPETGKKISASKIGKTRPNMDKTTLKLRGDARTEKQKAASKRCGDMKRGNPPHNKGKSQLGRRVKTPDGIFRTGKDVCIYYNLTSGTVVNRCNKSLFGFTYFDGDDVIENEITYHPKINPNWRDLPNSDHSPYVDADNQLYPGN